MKKWNKKRYCEKCENKVSDYNTTGLCNSCRLAARCPDCGRLLGQEDHICGSVESKGERKCKECEKVLSNQGFERWHTVCGKCSKKKWREKERAERKRLRLEFGGKCQECNYSKCQAALHFHHVDSTQKHEWNTKGGADLREIKTHPERFKLLCANCHIELHFPDPAETLC